MSLEHAISEFRDQFPAGVIHPDKAAYDEARTASPALTVRAPQPIARAHGCVAAGLVRAFGSRIFTIARHITQNEADAGDVLFETFLAISPDRDECHEKEALWLRLVTIAVREALSKIRKRMAGSNLSLNPESDEDVLIRELSVWGDDYQHRYPKEKMTRVLENGLRNLDPMARTVFVLQDMEQIPIEAVARIVNRSVAAVEVCLLRARLQVRENLAGYLKQPR